MAQKRISPYTRLQMAGRKFFHKILFPRRRRMFTFTNARLKEGGWTLWDVYQRVEAAKQLGYEVVVETDGNDLVLNYVERRPAPSELPYEFK